MPRGIPNAKRDETGMKWTTFSVPLALNPKHNTTTYLKSDAQTLWARNALKHKKLSTDEASHSSEQRRGSNVLVIHPGSRYLRIGRASDMRPVTVRNVIARRCKPPVPPPIYVQSIVQPSPDASNPFEGVEYSLKERRRYYKLEDTPNASSIVAEFNRSVKPDTFNNDPFNVEWIREDCQEDIIVGDRVLKLGDPQGAGYSVRWPLRGGTFNTRGCSSPQVPLNDFETILRHSLKNKLKIDSKDYSQFSVVFIVQDLYEKKFVREMCNLLLMGMGFKQLCVQQESMAATYGAGISSACVVNLGASCSTIACVDEGLVVPDTRLRLALGGDDITDFFSALLNRIDFPDKDMDLAVPYNWNLMDELKEKHCSLADSAVAINTYDFVSRGPNQKTMKWKFQAYGEVVLAPMCLFDIRPIDFDSRCRGQQDILHPDVTDEIMDWVGPTITQAMVSSTKHLMPSIPDNVVGLKTEDTTADGSGALDDDNGTAATDTNGMVVVDVTEEATKTTSTKVKTETASSPGIMKEYGIDVPLEASKLPLDVAIYNSVRAAGGDDRMKKYLNAVLVIGGTSLISSMDHALKSRLQGIMGPLFPGIDVQLIPPPKDVDRRALTWKGGAVLGKMEAANELWVTPSDWDMLEMRGLKERCFYLL